MDYTLNNLGSERTRAEINSTKKFLYYFVPFGAICLLFFAWLHTNGFSDDARSISMASLFGFCFLLFSLFIPLARRIKLWQSVVQKINLENDKISFTVISLFSNNEYLEIQSLLTQIYIVTGPKTNNKSILSKESYTILTLENGKKLYLIKSFWDDYPEILKLLQNEN